MKIDIISYSDTQYAALTEEQIQEVKAAQLKKNRLKSQLAEAKLKEKHRLIERGMFLSKIWNAYQEKLQAEYDQEIESLRDSLLFYLRFSTKVDSEDTGYTVNYDLSVEERLAIVRQYYESTYQNASERFQAFKEDKVAIIYLEDLYAPLYDYFLDQAS